MKMTKQQMIGRVSTALSLLVSVIKSGEKWSSECEIALMDAQDALVTLGQDEVKAARESEYCCHEGECDGRCQSA